MTPIKSVANRGGMCYFYMHQTSGTCASVFMCVCLCNRIHQMEKADLTIENSRFLL